MTKPPQSTRLVSLDAFRGFTIAAMILVNAPGTYRAVFSQLKHSEWHGWTFADTIFPFFLFIMGISIAFSFSAHKNGEIWNSAVEFKILKRTVILFALGVFLSSFPPSHLNTLRIPGVLQRIALCWFFAAVIFLKTGPKGVVYWIFGLLSAYWLMMRFFPVPGIGTGVLEPGRNFAAYFDELFLRGHMWDHYETWDPEGFASTIPAIASTLFGVLTGYWLLSAATRRKKALVMAGAGLPLVALGQILDIWFPINKSIWTSTFSIFMAGLALVCLSVFYWVIDVKNYSRWARVFVIFGVNPLAIYFLSEFLFECLSAIRLHRPDGSNPSIRAYLFRNFFAPLATPEVASLLFAVGFVLLMLAIAWILWNRHWFVKV